MSTHQHLSSVQLSIGVGASGVNLGVTTNYQEGQTEQITLEKRSGIYILYIFTCNSTSLYPLPMYDISCKFDSELIQDIEDIENFCNTYR